MTRALGRGAAWCALLLLPWLSGRARAGGDEVSAACRDLAASGPAARERAASALRSLGPGALTALAALDVDGDPDLARRVRCLERQIERDWHEAHVPPGMVYVPAGRLRVPVAHGDAWAPGPETVAVGAFYLDRTEVTVGAWRAWLVELEEDADGTRTVRPRSAPVGAAADLPVTGITYDEAERYAAEARGGRLPTIEELDLAARGGGGRPYPWGREMLRHRANLRGEGPGSLLPVGSFPLGAAPSGALDLLGNAAEWTSTRIPYAGDLDHRHLVFGGSWRDLPSPDLACRRAGSRLPEDGYRRSDVGFRVAQDVPPLPPPAAAGR